MTIAGVAAHLVTIARADSSTKDYLLSRLSAFV